MKRCKDMSHYKTVGEKSSPCWRNVSRKPGYYSQNAQLFVGSRHKKLFRHPRRPGHGQANPHSVRTFVSVVYDFKLGTNRTLHYYRRWGAELLQVRSTPPHAYV